MHFGGFVDFLGGGFDVGGGVTGGFGRGGFGHAGVDLVQEDGGFWGSRRAVCSDGV